MRGGRKQRQHYCLTCIGLIALLLAGCTRKASTASDDALFLQATSAFRKGDFRAAQALADKGSAGWSSQPQSLWYWKYRVLSAEALTNLGRSKDAVLLLETRPPNTAEFAEVL